MGKPTDAGCLLISPTRIGLFISDRCARSPFTSGSLSTRSICSWVMPEVTKSRTPPEPSKVRIAPYWAPVRERALFQHRPEHRVEVEVLVDAQHGLGKPGQSVACRVVSPFAVTVLHHYVNSQCLPRSETSQFRMPIARSSVSVWADAKFMGTIRFCRIWHGIMPRAISQVCACREIAHVQ